MQSVSVVFVFICLFASPILACNNHNDTKSCWCDGGEQQSKLTTSLNAFLLGTEPTSWSYNYLWGSESCPCDWVGVDCTTSNTTVTLNLSDNNIYGYISPDFCQDIYSSINLDNNELFQKIPDCFGEMVHLRSLAMRNNSLQGLLPESLGHLSKLVQLNVQDNHLAGPLPTYLQCPNQFFSSKADLLFSGNLFWCPVADWCSSSTSKSEECATCEEEPSDNCANLNAAACDAIIACCYKSSWDEQCDDFLDKTEITCTPDTTVATCKAHESSSEGILATILWILFAIAIILVILAVGLTAVFYITLRKRNWSFRAVRHELIKVDSETYMIDPEDDIYQDEQPPRSSLDYEL